MSHVNRYSSIPIIRRENVAEHSWYVTFYAYLIGVDLVRRGEVVDMEKLLTRALLHDIDESMTGDFLRVVKYGHPNLKKDLDEVSESVISDMEGSIGLLEALREPWKSAKADDLEGAIIQVADLARVASYVQEEISTGNTNVANVLRECKGYMMELVDDDSQVREYAAGIIDWIEERLAGFRARQGTLPFVF